MKDPQYLPEGVPEGQVEPLASPDLLRLRVGSLGQDMPEEESG